METEYKIDVERRITTVETGLVNLNGKLDEIRDNHLHHLDMKMDRIHWILVTTLITGIVTLLSKWLN